jgi:hypothetical protein
MIGNPKTRGKINSVIDKFCVGLFYCFVPFIVIAGAIVGAVGLLFRKVVK